MGYYISSMIGIRTGGVFSGETIMPAFLDRLAKVVKEAEAAEVMVDFDVPSACISPELVADKGSYIVIAGVFNYWNYESVSDFASRLSKEFVTEVMVMTWDEEQDKVQCNIFLDGRPLFEVNENPIGRILRRVA